MTKIALIAPGELPIPSMLDGAIETLATHIIEENEIQKKIEIVVFSPFHIEAKKQVENYTNTHGYFIRVNSKYAIIFTLFLKIIRKLLHKKDSIPPTYFLHKCIKKINNDNFDYILIEGGIGQVLPLKKQVQTKLILHVHADFLHTTTKKAKQIFDSCYLIIAVSQYIKKRIASINQAKMGNVIVLLNAVDLKKFDSSLYQKERIELRNKYEIKENEKAILFCGRLCEDKGVEDLLLACKQIRQSLKFKLIIIGTSWFYAKKQTEYEKKIITIAERMQNKPLFLGYISNHDMPQYYAMADIAVFPSKSNEAAGLVPLEALSCGIPTIASRKGGIPEYTNPLACDLINYDQDFVKNITKTITKFLKDEKYYQEKKKHAKPSVKNFSKEAYYTNFVNILNELKEDKTDDSFREEYSKSTDSEILCHYNLSHLLFSGFH